MTANRCRSNRSKLAATACAGVLLLSACGTQEPTARQRYFSALADRPGVAKVAPAYGGSRTAVVTLTKSATTRQAIGVLHAGRPTGCCDTVIRSGVAKIGPTDQTEDATMDQLLLLGRADLEGQVALGSSRADPLVTVSLDEGATQSPFAAARAVIGDGGSVLPSLQVGTGQGFIDPAVYSNDLTEGLRRNKLVPVLELAENKALHVEEVEQFDEELTLRLRADDRLQAARLWARAGGPARHAGVTSLGMRVGRDDDTSSVVYGRPGSAFADAKKTG